MLGCLVPLCNLYRLGEPVTGSMRPPEAPEVVPDVMVRYDELGHLRHTGNEGPGGRQRTRNTGMKPSASTAETKAS